MCGINGFNWDDRNLIKKSTDLLNHRGPDQDGFYNDENITLGHKRLSIIDLSEKGRQPMHNEDETVWVIFNGEIYNFSSLRTKLEKLGHKFYSNTDTEVIIHSYEQDFIDCLKEFNGQFSFCIYDKKKGILFLARDRFGIKPLYYYFKDKKFIFSSEIKSILEAGIKRELNLAGFRDYITFRYIIGNHSIFKNIYKIKPGHYLIYDLKNGKITQYSKYWDTDFSKKYFLDENEYCKIILKLFEESISRRLIADVPVGAFLSGGVDSSSVVAIISKFKEDLDTFSIKFDYQEFDESKYAKMVSDIFGTNHYEIQFSAKDVRKLIREIIYYYDEPFSDPAMIPTYLVSKVAREHVKVSLTGEGGDELFGGYSTYLDYKKLNIFNLLPNFLKKYGITPIVNLTSKVINKKGFNLIKKASYKDYEIFGQMTAPIKEQTQFSNLNLKIDYKDFKPYFKYNHYLDNLQEADLHIYLPYNNLTKVDRASMAVSLEARVPFLDHKLTEFVCKIPARFRINNYITKYILKKAFSNILPHEILYRKKHGFGVPLKYYFKKELKDLLIEHVLENKSHNLFNKNYIKRIIEKSENFYNILWMLLIFNLWYEKWFLN